MEEILHGLLTTVVDYAILLFEFIGVGILICSGIKGFIDCIRRKELTKLNLAKGMAMGLEFKLGSEILRTVVARDWGEILIVGGIIVLRAALTFLIHWEIKEEEHKTIGIECEKSTITKWFTKKKKDEPTDDSEK